MNPFEDDPIYKAEVEADVVKANLIHDNKMQNWVIAIGFVFVFAFFFIWALTWIGVIR